MNKTFMSGYYQGVIETAPATLSAAKTEQLAITMTILHLRHAGISITSIHDFLVNDLHANERLVNKYLLVDGLQRFSTLRDFIMHPNKYINLNADELEIIQAQVMAIAFNQ